jgi:hypothetical protein
MAFTLVALRRSLGHNLEPKMRPDVHSFWLETLRPFHERQHIDELVLRSSTEFTARVKYQQNFA